MILRDSPHISILFHAPATWKSLLGRKFFNFPVKVEFIIVGLDINLEDQYYILINASGCLLYGGFLNFENRGTQRQRVVERVIANIREHVENTKKSS